MSTLFPSLAFVLSVVAVCVTYLRAQRQRMEHAPLVELQAAVEALKSEQDKVSNRLKAFELSKMQR